MRTCTITALALLIVASGSAAAQPGPGTQPAAGAAPAQRTTGTSIDPDSFVYGNERMLAAQMAAEPQFSKWTDNDRKQFLAPGTGENLLKLARFAGGEAAYRQFLKAVEDARMDKQTGSSATSEGTTSVVSKGLASQVLALAVEEGALTRTDNKSIATFRGNALGVYRLLTGADQFPYCAAYDKKCQSPLAEGLSSFSFTASFDTTPSNSAPPAAATSSANKGVVTSGPSQQLSSWGFRYDHKVLRSVLDKQYQQDFQNTLKSFDGTEYSKAIRAFLEGLDTGENKDYNDWLTTYTKKLSLISANDQPALADLMNHAVTELLAIAKKKPEFQANLDKLLAAMGEYLGRRDRALEPILDKYTWSVEYDDDRPQNQPSQSSIKIVLSWRPKVQGTATPAGPLQVTFNANAAMYDHAPPRGTVKRFRDAQAALQADRSLTGAKAHVGAALTFGYYFQYMADNALLKIPSGDLAPGTSIALPGDASVLLNTKGAIHIAQLGVIFTVSGTGIKMPLTLSYSSRTELIKASTMRGHFGLSYDLDSLFAGRSTTPSP